MNTTITHSIFDLFANPDTDYKEIVLRIAKMNPDMLYSVINSDADVMVQIVKNHLHNKIEAIKAIRVYIGNRTGKQATISSTKLYVEEVMEKGFSTKKIECN